jgi:hypothetical protein
MHDKQSFHPVSKRLTVAAHFEPKGDTVHPKAVEVSRSGERTCARDRERLDDSKRA